LVRDLPTGKDAARHHRQGQCRYGCDTKRRATKEKFKLLGVLPRASTPQELAAMNVADAALWGPIIKEANIKVE
jgi:hypothetical protein